MTGGAQKGVIVSVLVHIVVCALMGFVAMHAPLSESKDPIFDVALMGGGSPAPAPAAPAAPPPPVPETPITPPEPDDIVEEHVPEPLPPQPETPPVPETPAPETPMPPAPAPAPAEGQGSGAQSGAQGDGAGPAVGDGTGQNDGVPAESNAIEAPAVPPHVTASQPPEYPSSARNRNIEGRVVVRFLVGKAGEVEDLDIAESSGNDALDRAALDAAEGFAFSPGLDGYGRPVRCYAYQSFTFRLQ